ncbi:hypothetical protein HU200_016585 [Digitaria exilis]|uniref:F-box domain-containing protein n=1 Tax=Digitaria exilis TaxID=1010633 RepID=A0A835F7Z3_9POAL|nr:hypothetical protein HU200_016585 [Digitaria exilis]
MRMDDSQEPGGSGGPSPAVRGCETRVDDSTRTMDHDTMDSIHRPSRLRLRLPRCGGGGETNILSPHHCVSKEALQVSPSAIHHHRPQTRQGDVVGDGETTSIGATIDTLYEILLRVPAKPLCRFRAVCHSWRSLLSSPSPFITSHAARHRDQPPLVAVCGMVPGSDHREAEIRLAVRRVLRRVWTTPAHLDGLVLIVRLVARGRDVDDDDEHHRLSVLDPATGAVSDLPVHYDDDDDYGDDDASSSFVFGWAAASSSIGGDDDDGEYKVLSINTRRRYYYAGTHKLCKILTVGGDGGSRGTWRDAPGPPVAIKTFHRGETVVANGVVYHLADDNSSGWTIAAFDLEAEQWLPELLHGPTVVPVLLPSAATNNSSEHRRRSLAEVNKRLAAVHSTCSTMDVWLLMGSQWCKRCRVVASSSTEWQFWPVMHPVPLWVLDDGRVIFCLRSPLICSLQAYNYRRERARQNKKARATVIHGPQLTI